MIVDVLDTAHEPTKAVVKEQIGRMFAKVMQRCQRGCSGRGISAVRPCNSPSQMNVGPLGTNINMHCLLLPASSIIVVTLDNAIIAALMPGNNTSQSASSIVFVD